MKCVLNARIAGDALALNGPLSGAGFRNPSALLLAPADLPHRRAASALAGSMGWGLLGAVVGGALGWLVLSLWSSPEVGALWGALVGGICSGGALKSGIDRDPGVDAHGVQRLNDADALTPAAQV